MKEQWRRKRGPRISVSRKMSPIKFKGQVGTLSRRGVRCQQVRTLRAGQKTEVKVAKRRYWSQADSDSRLASEMCVNLL